MCFELRNTLRRGRSVVPVMFRRTWWRRRSWRLCLAFWWSMTLTWVGAAKPPAAKRLSAAGEGLAFLAAYLFAFVADALALVRLRLADGADLGGVLAHLLLVRTADHDRRRVRQFHRHALRRRHLDGVGVAD